MDLKTLRSYRILGIAMFDLVMSFLGFYIIDKIFNFKNKKAYYLSIIPIGVLSHIFTNQNTYLNSQLFSQDFNIIQILVAANIILLYKELI